jgi:DNA-binding beta-propeller fold protein YncE
MSFKHLIIFVLPLLYLSCVKDKPQPQDIPDIDFTSSQKVYIVNEGNFMNGNASVSLFDTGNNQVTENYYQARNNSALGDVAQSISRINGDFYIVINNSGKVVVCNPEFKFKKQINGFTSPRYLLQISNKKAYVSDLYANAITILDLNNGIKTGSISCFGWTEQMVMFYNKVFVTNISSNYLYVINAINDEKEDSVFVGKGCGSLVIDKNDQLWALSGGTVNVTPTLWKINPLKLSEKTSYAFKSTDKPGNLCINGGKDTLYYLNQGICRMPINSSGLQNAFIEKGNKNFYALAVNPENSDIYVSDALDYIQKSNIYIYKASGALKVQFKAGIISGNFYFD